MSEPEKSEINTRLIVINDQLIQMRKDKKNLVVVTDGEQSIRKRINVSTKRIQNVYEEIEELGTRQSIPGQLVDYAQKIQIKEDEIHQFTTIHVYMAINMPDTIKTEY